MSILKIFNKIFSLSQKFYFILMVFIFLVSMILETFTIALIIPLVSFLLEEDHKNNFFFNLFREKLNIDVNFLSGDFHTFLIFFGLIFLLKTVFILICRYQILKFTIDINKFIILKLYAKYLNFSFSKFLKKNSSELIKNLTYEVELFSSGLFHFLELVSEVIILIGILLFLLLFNFKISITAGISVFVVVAIFHLLTRKKIVKIGEKIRYFEQRRLKNYIESFNLIKEIKLFNNKSFFLDINKKYTFKFWDNDFISRFIRSIPKPILELILIIVIISILMILNATNSSIYIMEFLGVFLAAAYRVTPSVFKVIASIQYIKSATPAISNLENELSDEDEIKKGRTLKNFNNKIILNNVYYKYPGTEKFVINNFNYVFKMGKIIGIKGPTGSSKTTLINLICGLISPSKGEIIIDDIPYKDLNIESIQKVIGYVPQNIYLMDTSIKENISFGKGFYNEEELNETIKAANLQNFIKQLPSGLKTIIGEKGNKISGGQAQRIGLARALIKKPSILVLDEATSALDSESEKLILKTLQKLKGQVTIILISHSEKPLTICDEIIDLKELEGKSI